MTEPVDTDAIRRLWDPNRHRINTDGALTIHYLCGIIDRLNAAPCPHVATSDEGTSHCTLAETGREPREVKD